MSIETQISGISVKVYSTSSDASEAVANEITQEITTRDHCVLGLATGGTPVDCYQRLVERHRNSGLSFADVTTFNLDEYIGLAADHPQSYRAFMQAQLFDHVDVRRERTWIPSGVAEDVSLECTTYESRIREAGGIDLQLLGLGHNGHIAFNEPGSPLESRTRQVELTPETIQKNARFFADDESVPRHAITMGIATILEARRIVMLVTGSSKAAAVSAMVEGPVGVECPASLLRNHPQVQLIVDEAAAAKLDVS